MIEAKIKAQDPKNMDFFFRSVPMFPYKYNYYPYDGADVGKYFIRFN